VIVCCIWRDWWVHPWSFAVTAVAAFVGAAFYFPETASHTHVLADLAWLEHKYELLLVITVTVLGLGFTAFVAGRQRPLEHGS